jgi:hypothetical protein
MVEILGENEHQHWNSALRGWEKLIRSLRFLTHLTRNHLPEMVMCPTPSSSHNEACALRLAQRDSQPSVEDKAGKLSHLLKVWLCLQWILDYSSWQGPGHRAPGIFAGNDRSEQP